MKMIFLCLSAAMVVALFSCGDAGKTASPSAQPMVELVSHESGKKIDVMVNGKFFTSYAWPDSIMKTILYPVLTSAGTEITRGFPMHPRAGERTDHPHHVGIWFNYGNVNGYDFWNNSYDIPDSLRKIKYGTIKHLSVKDIVSGPGEGSLTASEGWIDPSGKQILSENTAYHFIAKDSLRIIDRITTLTATGDTVLMKDTKEGVFGIRMARQLELPSKEEVILTDANGIPTAVKQLSNEGVTGNYRSSEGASGDSAWGTRATWMDLYGNIGQEKIDVIICDHPKNVSYPTYWHARGYGLFSANPLGVKDFTKDKETLNFSIPAGQSVTFRYRVIVNSGTHLTNEEINALAADFSAKY